MRLLLRNEVWFLHTWVGGPKWVPGSQANFPRSGLDQWTSPVGVHRTPVELRNEITQIGDQAAVF